MILSLKPPYDISPGILKLISSISIKLGEVNANFLNRQTPLLRKQNRIKTIHASLSIEGNTLSEDQITAIIEKKRVVGPQKDILEVLNAAKVYESIQSYNPFAVKSFLSAHKTLMDGLIDSSGKFRSKGAGIVKGSKITHIAPHYQNVPGLMNDLFDYLKNDDDLLLIKSCVFHYEMEFIHPFADGNGRMGRLWQTLILQKAFPVFEFLPLETIVRDTQKEYYQSLGKSDKKGNSTPFIEYMLNVIDKSLDDLLNYNNRVMTDLQRIEYFIHLGKKEFSRKDYMLVFKNLSSATASRDLQKGTELNFFKKEGERNKARYFVK